VLHQLIHKATIIIVITVLLNTAVAVRHYCSYTVLVVRDILAGADVSAWGDNRLPGSQASALGTEQREGGGVEV
jgi:hypothetical protein